MLNSVFEGVRFIFFAWLGLPQPCSPPCAQCKKRKRTLFEVPRGRQAMADGRLEYWNYREDVFL